MSMNSSSKNLKSRNSNSNSNHKEKNESEQQIINKERAYSQHNNPKKRTVREKRVLSQKILRKKNKNLTTINTTRDNTLSSEFSKNSIYYEKFINIRYSDFSEEEMQNKLKEEKNEDKKFLEYILYNIYNIATNNNEVNKEKEKKYKCDFNIIRKYMIKIEINFKQEAENIINKNKYNQNYFLIHYFVKKLQNLMSRYAIIIFFFVQKKNLTHAKIIFSLMIKENLIYINYIEKSITEWYSLENKNLNIGNDFPKIIYDLIMIYSFIIKYSWFFNMNRYNTIFLGRYFDMIYFIYNFFLIKANIRGFNLDTNNQLKFWFSLILHHANYLLISNYFPLNIPIYFNNQINKLYKNSNEDNLTNNEKSIIIKTLYNLGLFCYLNDQNDKAITNLKNAKDMIINSDESNTYQRNIFHISSQKKESMPLFKQNYINILKNIDTIQLNSDIETNRLSTTASLSETINFNDFQNIKISKDMIKEAYLRDKINVEDINLLINYGIGIGLLNENGHFNYMINITPTNKSPKYKFKYLSIPEFFFNPFLRKIELLMCEIELSRKNYLLAYDHVLKAYYIIIALRLNKKGGENIKINKEQKIIQKYIELIIPHNLYNLNKDNFGIKFSLFNKSTINKINKAFEKNNKAEVPNDNILNKYQTNIITKKKKNEFLFCGKKEQDHKILKEIEKFFIFLNKLSLYQLKILNETQPNNIKKNDLPIYFSSQFKDSLINRQRTELNNIQTMALTRLIVLKNENNWILPNNLNLSIVDENKIENNIRRRTIKFINKYFEDDDKEIPKEKTREYLKFQEIINSQNINKELKEYINDNKNTVIKLIKNLNDKEIKNIIETPNIIIEPIKSYKNKKLKKLKKFTNKTKEKENDEDIYRLHRKNNYDYDSNYSSNRKNMRCNTKNLSSNISFFKMIGLNSNKKNKEYLNYNYWINRDKRNNSVQYNDKIKHRRNGIVDYYNNYY